jgi:hypothetical protein
VSSKTFENSGVLENVPQMTTLPTGFALSTDEPPIFRIPENIKTANTKKARNTATKIV